MNKRTISIIHELCAPEKPISISGLAGQFGVSQRTIRNDLNTINDILNENELLELKLKSGGQIIRDPSFDQILSFVSDGDFYAYKLSKGERIRIASALLVTSSEYTTLSAIADTLFVSRATVINDLEEIKTCVKEGGLEVVSHPSRGLRVQGTESDKRVFLLKAADSGQSMAEQELMTGQIHVPEETRTMLQKIITEQEHIHKCYLTDDSFQKVLLYLEIMINRNLAGEYMEVRRKNVSGKHQMAQDILELISQYCHFRTTEDEIQFLSELLSMARYTRQRTGEGDAVKLQFITRQFIWQISEELRVNLNGDYDFFENLSAHLESVYSAASPVYPDNPIIEEILEENAEVAAAVRKKLPILQQYTGEPIEEIELGYITVHVCAALERKKNKEIAFHVIVACHAGIGTSQLLLERLKKHFNFQIVDIISVHEAKNMDPGKADFIISTVPLEGCGLDHVIVSPLLNDEDYIRVGNKIDSLRDSRNLPVRGEEHEITAKGLLEKLDPVIRESVPDAAPELIRKIRKIVGEYFNQTMDTESEAEPPYLHELLPHTRIMLDVECGDWKEAVRRSGEILLDMGYIEARYIDAMITNIEENGPYIVLSPGFAVPHEGVEQGSIRVGMSLIRLKDPVPFGVEELDPVEFVCCLSAVDHKTHLRAFFNLVNLLRDENFKQSLHQCRTPEEAAGIIEKYEYETAE